MLAAIALLLVVVMRPRMIVAIDDTIDVARGVCMEPAVGSAGVAAPARQHGLVDPAGVSLELVSMIAPPPSFKRQRRGGAEKGAITILGTQNRGDTCCPLRVCCKTISLNEKSGECRRDGGVDR